VFLHVVNNIWPFLCSIHYIENLPQVEAREEQEAAIIKCCQEPWESDNESDAKMDLMEWAMEETMAAFTCPLLGICLL